MSKSLLAEGARQLEELLNELQTEKRRLDDLEKLLGREKDSLQRQNKSLAVELKSVRENRQSIIQQARDAVIEEVSALQRELKQARTALERDRSLAAVANAKEVSDIVRSQLKRGIWQVTPDATAADNEIVAVGDRVYLKEAGIEATVTGINERSGQVEVSSGSMNFKLAREGVTKSKTPAPKAVEPKVKITSSGSSIGLELDLRGKRADDIEILLDEYLNDAATANLPEVRIIHGHGTGAVRSLVRELAAKHPLVSSYAVAPRDQGGDGATLLRLK
jgi:DNA mismatch repair protein MutS2